MTEILSNAFGVLEVMHDGCELHKNHLTEEERGSATWREEFLLNSNGSIYKQVPAYVVQSLVASGAIVRTERRYEAVARGGEPFDSLKTLETPAYAWKFVDDASMLVTGTTLKFAQDRPTLQVAHLVGIDALNWGTGTRLCRLKVEGVAWQDGPPMISSAVYPTQVTCLWAVDASLVLHKLACLEIADVLDSIPTLAGLVDLRARVVAGQQSDWELREARRKLDRFGDFLSASPRYAAKSAGWNLVLHSKHYPLIAEFEAMLLGLAPEGQVTP